jgi:hypothetical protein
LAIVDRVSSAVVIVDGAAEFMEVTDAAGEENVAIFDDFSLLGSVFVFFSTSREHWGL